MRVMIVGAGGQLGKEFVRALSSEHEVIPLSHSELPVEDFNEVWSTLREYKPDLVINCSAYNKVDIAEDEWQLAYEVNALGPYNLAVACEEYRALLVHFSTDYVFDGEKGSSYEEDDPPNPLNQYGRSKLLGERLLQRVTERYLIFRVSWVYGVGKQNFIFKLLSWAKDRDRLLISYDEFSVPTWTGFIVENTMRAVIEGLTGLYHLTPNSFTSRFEWARAVNDILNLGKEIIPVSRSRFNLRAARPLLSAMSSQKLQRALGVKFLSWEHYLHRFLERDLDELLSLA